MSDNNNYNEPLLRECIDAIEANPEEWNQGAWQIIGNCGTSYCLAGWAIHLTHPEVEDIEEFCEERRVSISNYAGGLLGFSRYECDVLFAGQAATPMDTCGGQDLNYFKKKITRITGIEFKVKKA